MERIDLGDGYWFQPSIPGKRSGLILDEDGGTVGYCNGGEGEARAWVDGYATGMIRGEHYGAEKVRRAMRDVLGVPHPKTEE